MDEQIASGNWIVQLCVKIVRPITRGHSKIVKVMTPGLVSFIICTTDIWGPQMSFNIHSSDGKIIWSSIQPVNVFSRTAMQVDTITALYQKPPPFTTAQLSGSLSLSLSNVVNFIPFWPLGEDVGMMSMISPRSRSSGWRIYSSPRPIWTRIFSWQPLSSGDQHFNAETCRRWFRQLIHLLQTQPKVAVEWSKPRLEHGPRQIETREVDPLLHDNPVVHRCNQSGLWEGWNRQVDCLFAAV